ncbi:thiamine phosphate synthase [Haliea sp. E17]|uniref:thiamine phosphate synthase n=1 Tax=Haliea sp. E17 TaxID=3401576 RepID=UPI003AAA91F9
MDTGTMQPVVYAIAGSDCSGGAGVEADLATFRDLGVYGCSVITALTAQNRNGVQRVTATPLEQVRASLASLRECYPPAAVKLGMLASSDIQALVGEYLQQVDVPVVCDPVLAASAGGTLLDDDGIAGYRELLPRISLLTPNRDEAERLCGFAIDGPGQVEAAARYLLRLGCGAVLVTGGHLDLGDGYCYDYFCTAGMAFWLRGERIPTPHSHGTGCTLSSAIAAALGRGYALEDAVVLGRMVVGHGLRHARALAGGSGAVDHGSWTAQLADLPGLWSRFPGDTQSVEFPAMDTVPMGLYPVVDSAEWVEKLFAEGVSTVQLRVKDAEEHALRESIRRAVAAQRRYGAQLFINDYWQLAIDYRAYGVHLGQEDIATADLAAIADAGLRLGLSNHAWHELARAHALKPSYIALGPIYSTTTKAMRFAPQGLAQLQQWVDTLGGHYPLTAIGGIDEARAAAVAATGVGSIAVVRAITEAADYRRAVRRLASSLRATGGWEPMSNP